MTNKLGDLLDELDFESWLDHEGIQYKLTRGKSGLQANIRECPCCGNSKWKVYFGLETGFGNCFVCEERFNKWQFIASHLNVSNANVFRYLESFMQTQGWKPKVQTEHKPAHKPATLQLPESLPIPINGRNLKYLQDRNVTVELAAAFGLRYSHAGRFDFTAADGRPAFQDYSRRIIIPVLDLDGSLVSFQGRDITGTAEKKYLFPPEFASTGSIIYNGHTAMQKKPKRLVLGEGVFDCIATQAAIELDPVLRSSTLAAATFGKKLGAEQLDKLKRLQVQAGLEAVVFMWDGERAALQSAVDAAVECRGHGIRSLVAKLPKDRDPNEVEPEVVTDAIWNATEVTPQTAIKLKLDALRL
jgi:DNA primase